MKKIKLLIVATGLLTNLYASDYSVELFSGFVYNMKEDIVNTQNGQTNIVMNDAELKTKPQTPPFYYGIRVSKWYEDDTAWEIEHVHQKLYIDDLPADVQKWEITDGFNFFFLNKAWKDKDMNLVYRVGTGLVITHPDITVRDKSNHKRGHGAITYGEGYHLSGFVLQASAQKLFELTPKWYLTTELKATYAKANVPIAEGSVNVQNRALHLNFGAGYKF